MFYGIEVDWRVIKHVKMFNYRKLIQIIKIVQIL